MMIRFVILLCSILVTAWPGESAPPQTTAIAASRILKEIAKLKPDSTEVQQSNALDEVHREVRSALAAKLNDTAPYVDAGIAASGPRALQPMRSFWAPLVEACTIDQPKVGRMLISGILANPKLPIRARGWIISYILSNARAGQALSWMPSQTMLQLAKDLSLVQDVFHTVRVVAITTKGDGDPVVTAFTGPMLAASILQGYFCIPLSPRWDDTISGDPEVLTARTAMLAQLPIALEDAVQRTAIAESTLHILSNWPRFSYGPNQRSWMARLMIGSRRADLALLQEVALLAKSEIRRQPNADPALVGDYIEGIRKMWEDGPLPRNATGPGREKAANAPPLPRVPANLNSGSVDAWLKDSFAIMKPTLLERAVGGLVSADLDAVEATLGLAP